MNRASLALSGFLVLLPVCGAQAYVAFGPVRYMHPDGGSNAREDVAVHLVTDGAGNWIAATTGPYISTSSDNGDTWTTPTLAPGGPGANGLWATEPMVATDGSGTWLLTWVDRFAPATGDAEVLLSRSTDNGATWTAPVMIASNALVDDEYTNRPRLATDQAGNWMAVWHEGDPVNGDDDIRFTTSSDNGLTWAPVEWIDGNALLDTIDQNWADVATDGAGNWVVTYNQFGSVPVPTDWRIWAVSSADFGATWGSPQPLGQTLGLGVSDVEAGGAGIFATAHARTAALSSNTSDAGASWDGPNPIGIRYGANQSRARIATDGQGEWVAIWDTISDPFGIGGSDREIVYARSTTNGATWFPDTYVDQQDAIDNVQVDNWSDIATDGAGRWIAAWQRDDDIVMAISDILCPVARRNDCITGASGKSKFSISDKDGTEKDKLKFKVAKADATELSDFGAVLTTDELLLCVWDSSGDVDELVWRSPVPAGGTCNGKPCWKQTSSGFSYLDKEFEQSDIRKAKLKAGETGKASVNVQAGGNEILFPRLPFANDSSLAVQLISIGSDRCWGATFSTPKKNQPGKYVGKSD